MKIKFGLAFIILAAAFVYFTFRGGYFGSDQPVVEKQNSYSTEAIVGRLLSFDLRDYQGNKLELESGKLKAAKKIVIHLWASWCGPCVNEVPELVAFSKKNQDVMFVIVSLDDYQDDIEKFLKSFPEFNSQKYVRVWDRDKVISKYFDADRLPMSVIINETASQPQLLKAVVDWKHIKI